LNSTSFSRAFGGKGLIQIVNYKPDQTQEILEISSRLRAALGYDALTIHHIVSTSVPNLAAKDVIDIQVSISKLEEEILKTALKSADFIYRPEIPASALALYLNVAKLILIL
jgi:GrpB-like predicted nucleotidyltransferase (UPF0157 family)